MTWQDFAIGIANIGFIFALLPLLFSLFGVKTIELGLVFTGSLYGLFLLLTAAGIIGLGAYFGGAVTLICGLLWFCIAGISALKNHGGHKNRKRSTQHRP